MRDDDNVLSSPHGARTLKTDVEIHAVSGLCLLLETRLSNSSEALHVHTHCGFKSNKVGVIIIYGITCRVW